MEARLPWLPLRNTQYAIPIKKWFLNLNAHLHWRAGKNGLEYPKPSRQEEPYAPHLKHEPKSTSNVEQAKSDIDEYGYCLIENALEPAVVDVALSRLREQAAAELELGAAFEDGGPKQQWGAFTDGKGRPRQQAYTAEAGGVNQRVWMLVNKGRIFRQILSTKRVRDVVDHVLGEDYLLSSYSANIAKPGGVAMNLHTDQWWMPHPINREPSPVPVGSITRERPNLAGEDPPQMIAPCVCVNVMWMLNDFSAENGGTLLCARQPPPRPASPSF